ncbi:MAG: hypothetical protein ACUZ8H_00160 [Candidatus Anammoxibacter sp.]
MPNGKLNIQEWEDSQLPNKYAAVSTLDWYTVKGPNHSYDVLIDSADPNASTNYDAAPISSKYSRSSNGDEYVKISATVWELVGLQS